MQDLRYCPKCGAHMYHKKTYVEGGLRDDDGGWSHDALQCLKCKTEFTVWG